MLYKINDAHDHLNQYNWVPIKGLGRGRDVMHHLLLAHTWGLEGHAPYLEKIPGTQIWRRKHMSVEGLSLEVVSPPLVVGDLPLALVGQTSYVVVVVECTKFTTSRGSAIPYREHFWVWIPMCKKLAATLSISVLGTCSFNTCAGRKCWSGTRL